MIVYFFWVFLFIFIYFFWFFIVVALLLLCTALDTNFFFLLFLHVPLAWCGSLVYIFLLVSCLCFFYFRNLIWLLSCFILCCLGFCISLLILWTGSCWALPVWGSFFVLDARVLSIIFLNVIFFFGGCFLISAYFGRISYSRVLVMLLLSSLNFPLIKLSVYWWHSLHQVSSVVANAVFIHGALYFPLLICFFFLFCFFFVCSFLLFVGFYEFLFTK